ncbi:MAG: enoyl-CoA hydratase/isomerase family protein [Lawsonibacter sp.]|jgi:enoyl-CoA hydratase/carnithine racemase|nr:enoyl-CoA hydratase/isomerase family protein [Lawsonibacter sp.]
MDYTQIKVAIDERVGIITLCHPPRNSFTKRMLVEVLTALDEFEDNDVVRAVMMNSEGPDFSKGADFDDIDDEWSGAGEIKATFSELGGRLVERVDFYPKPTLVAARGVCFGGSAAVFSSFDIRIAGENFQLHDGDIYYGTVGSWGMSSLRLPVWIGRNRMMDYMFLNENFNGRQLYEMGMVSKVVPDEAVDEIGLKFAKKMSKAAPIAARMFKECVRRATLANYAELRKAEEEVAAYIYTTEDCKNGLTSLTENEDGPMCEFMNR